MENKVENQLFYSIKDVAKITSFSKSFIYSLLRNESLGIEHKRTRGHMVQRKSGAFAKSGKVLITQQGLDQLVNLINNELI